MREKFVCLFQITYRQLDGGLLWSGMVNHTLLKLRAVIYNKLQMEMIA